MMRVHSPLLFGRAVAFYVGSIPLNVELNIPYMARFCCEEWPVNRRLYFGTSTKALRFDEKTLNRSF